MFCFLQREGDSLAAAADGRAAIADAAEAALALLQVCLPP
jgi:hypothetical protein